MEGTLVFGATGFLGAWVAAQAHKASRRLATFADPNGVPVWGIGRQIEQVPRFSDPRDGVRWEALDLESTVELEVWLGKRAPERIIGCAGLTRLDDCEADPARAQVLNVDIPARIAAWCHGAGVRYLHISTDLVFDGRECPSKGYHEDASAMPLSVYGRSKLAGEQAVLSADPAALVVRLPLLYGDSGGRGLGASDSLLAAVDRGESPQLFVDEWRTPLEVSNAAEALWELSRSETRGVLHLAGPDRVSRYDLGIAVLKAMGLAADEAAACLTPTPREDRKGWDLRPEDAALRSEMAGSLLETELLGLAKGLIRAIG